SGTPVRLLLGEPGKERAVVHTRLLLAELETPGPLARAAEILRHQLHAVTDAECRHAEPVDPWIDAWRAVRVHGRRAAAQHQRERVPRPNLLGGDAVADELRVDPALADAARDQLRVLPAEVDDQHRALLGREVRLRKGDDLPHQPR